MFSTHTLRFFKTDSDQRAGVYCASHELDLNGLMPDEEYAPTRRADLYAVNEALQMMATTHKDCTAAEVHIQDALFCGLVVRENESLKANYFG
jgi:hypothetical protein